MLLTMAGTACGDGRRWGALQSVKFQVLRCGGCTPIQTFYGSVKAGGGELHPQPGAGVLSLLVFLDMLLNYRL